MAPIITLLTDFGLADAYAAILHGIILGLNPAATVVDISHQVPPQDIRHGAYLLATAYRHFPRGTIHTVVIDPGVGSDRAALAAEANGHRFVGPDNGVLSHALAGGWSALVRLEEPRFWRPNPSRTFHGRDILAPVAAHLSLGVALGDLGPPQPDLMRLPQSTPVRRPDGTWLAHVIHVDRFGNLITDLQPDPAALSRLAGAEVHGRFIDAVVRTYAEVPSGAPAILPGSEGYLEIAIRDGDARAELRAEVGDQVLFRPQ